MYFIIHSDHESGNVSAHRCTSLAPPFRCVLLMAAGMCGLAGPLHGLANQEVLRWIMDRLRKDGRESPDERRSQKFLWDTLNSGKVVPGTAMPFSERPTRDMRSA